MAVIDHLKNDHPDCDIILNLTAAGGIANSEEDRMAPFMTLKPEMASFDCGSMNWMYNGVFNNNPLFLKKMGLAMQEAKVKPEVEVFDPGMIYDVAYYLKKGILKAPLHFQFCMGCAGGITATAENLIFMRNTLERDTRINLECIRSRSRCNGSNVHGNRSGRKYSCRYGRQSLLQKR